MRICFGDTGVVTMEAQTARRAEENKMCENRFQHLGQRQLAHNKKPLYAGQFQKSQYKCYSWEHSVQVVLEKKNLRRRSDFSFFDLLYA